MKVLYSKQVVKRIKKHQLPKVVWQDFRDAFESLALTKNYRLFDVKKMMRKGEIIYYRLRLRKYRALFHCTKDTIFVEDIGPRGEIYKR